MFMIYLGTALLVGLLAVGLFVAAYESADAAFPTREDYAWAGVMAVAGLAAVLMAGGCILEAWWLL